MRKVLYTVDAYKDIEKESWFDRVSKKRNKWYSDKHGAIYKNIEINNINRNPAHYHKLNALEDFIESDFDRAVLVDMDIYFEDICPDVWKEFPNGVAMCFDYLMLISTHYKPWCASAHKEKAQPNIVYNGDTNHIQECDGRGNKLRYFNTGFIIFDKEYANFILENLKPEKIKDGKEIFKDGWGEQHEINYYLDINNYTVFDLPRDYNEMTGLTKSRGRFVSHYAAPWGRFELSQREVHENEKSFIEKYSKKNYKICSSLEEASLVDLKSNGWAITISDGDVAKKLKDLGTDREILSEEKISNGKVGVTIVSKEMRKKCRDDLELIFNVQEF